MGVTEAALSLDELTYLQNVVLSEKILNDGVVTKLNRSDSPVYNMMVARGRKEAQPPRGAFRVYVSGNRTQKLTWWDGRDILPFDDQETTMKMIYQIGRGHMGIEFMLDYLLRAGVQVEYKQGVRLGRSTGRRAMAEVAIRVMQDKFSDIDYNFTNEMRKTVWNDNAAIPKAFTGIRGLLPPETNNTGTIGNLPRSNPDLQHNLITNIDVDNVESAFHVMHRQCTRFARTGIDMVACGDNFYDMLVERFIGTSTNAGKQDYRAKRDYAKQMGEKLGVGLPQDAFVTDNNVLIVNDPTFKELQDEFTPTVSWKNLCWFFNFDHLYMVPVFEQDINHGVPYNQRVSRSSKHMELTVVCDHPKAQGILAMA